MEDSQEKGIFKLPSQLYGALPLDRIYKVGFPALSVRQITSRSLGRDTQDELREGPLS
jgi:hypothetical protein